MEFFSDVVPYPVPRRIDQTGGVLVDRQKIISFKAGVIFDDLLFRLPGAEPAEHGGNLEVQVST
jgi:hypothetical protein